MSRRVALVSRMKQEENYTKGQIPNTQAAVSARAGAATLWGVLPLWGPIHSIMVRVHTCDSGEWVSGPWMASGTPWPKLNDGSLNQLKTLPPEKVGASPGTTGGQR